MRSIITSFLILSACQLFSQSQPFGLSLYFDKADHTLSVENRLKLDDLRVLLKDSTFNSVFIKGYADNDGSEEYNLELSEKRVEAVQSYFYGNRYEVKTKCYGEKEAINKNRTEEEKLINRRVDVIFWTNYEWGKERKPAQVFKGLPNRQIEFTAAEGTKIKIPANALVYANGSVPLGEVEIEVTEYYSMSDIIQNKLTTSSNGEMLISAGMINIEASRNDKELVLKTGTTMEVGFADRSENDGFGVFYGEEDPFTQVVNWVPAVDTRTVEEDWYYSGIKLFMSDTVERWRSKLEFNDLGQRIKVTELWVEGKGISFDTLIVDKTINKNNIILQSTRLGWINCDMFYDSSKPQRDLIVETEPGVDPDIVLIFTERKSMIQPTKTIEGKYVFSGVPDGEKVIITGIGGGEGKLLFTKQEFTTGDARVLLSFEEATINRIKQELSGYN